MKVMFQDFQIPYLELLFCSILTEFRWLLASVIVTIRHCFLG